MKNGYELFVRPLLFSLDAETAHHLTIDCFKARRISIPRCACSDLFSRRRNQKRSLVLTSQTQLDLRPGWTKTVLLFPRGQRSGSVLSRLGP